MRQTHLVGLFLLLLVVPLAGAHPVPKDNHDRTLVVRLTPEAVVVEYRLEVDEYRAARDLPRSELTGVASRNDFYAAFARYHAGVLANNLVAALDGRDLEFTCIQQRHQLLDHVRCDFRFRAPWKLAANHAHRFTFRESNYELESFSALHLSLDSSPELTLRDIVAPDEVLLVRPASQRKPGDDDRLRKLSATVLAEPSCLPGVARTALPPDADPVRDAASRRLRGIVGRGKPVPSYPVGWVRTTPPPTDEREEEKAAEGHAPLLHLLLDSRQGLLAVLLLAAGFGAAHALTPGHGKTLVAAYLIGQRGTIGHALGLGLVTALTHTGGVILLAVLMAVWFRGVSPGAIQSALALVGGLLIAGLGLWLLMTRLLGQADHVHLPGGHHHPHTHGGASAEAPQAGWWQIVVLGVAGGIIPCWDAIGLLIWAISVQPHRLWLSVLLLLAFSAGLAGVLVVLGVVVVRAGEAAHARMGDQERFQKLVRALPIVSAAVITVMGLILTFTAGRIAP